MPVYAIGDLHPALDPTSWVAPQAHVVGSVTLGAHTSVWFGAILRGDNEPIIIGQSSNVQENAVLHVDPGMPLTVGDHVTIGHQAMLHGCTVGDGSLIGIQAIVLNGARIGRNCLVGAGALVTSGKTFPDGAMIVGAPAKLSRMLSEEEILGLQQSATHYVERARHYRLNLKALG